MERTMSVEDKIRRAEEIYYRRRNEEMPIRETAKKQQKTKKEKKILRKLIKQIIICLIIYGIFYFNNNNYIFSEEFTNKAKEILSQNINFSQIYLNIKNKINEIISNTPEEITEEEQKMQEETTNVTTEEQQEIIEEDIQNNNENIGGAEESSTEELSQMEQDANYIKTTISFIKPVNGTISSKFGWRNTTIETVPKNHTGTDIAAIIGTKIISATDGTVILKSSQGDYGNHIKIQINDVEILYAHCNKIYVNEGDTIKQGQEIAEVGSTGNTTGPHLHFAIKYQERYVDPQLILEL